MPHALTSCSFNHFENIQNQTKLAMNELLLPTPTWLSAAARARISFGSKEGQARMDPKQNLVFSLRNVMQS